MTQVILSPDCRERHTPCIHRLLGTCQSPTTDLEASRTLMSEQWRLVFNWHRSSGHVGGATAEQPFPSRWQKHLASEAGYTFYWIHRRCAYLQLLLHDVLYSYGISYSPHLVPHDLFLALNVSICKYFSKGHIDYMCCMWPDFYTERWGAEARSRSPLFKTVSQHLCTDSSLVCGDRYQIGRDVFGRVRGNRTWCVLARSQDIKSCVCDPKQTTTRPFSQGIIELWSKLNLKKRQYKSILSFNISVVCKNVDCQHLFCRFFFF